MSTAQTSLSGKYSPNPKPKSDIKFSIHALKHIP